MLVEMREQGHKAISELPDKYLPVVVRWLNLLAAAQHDSEVEPEELWLLASGQLKQLVDAIEDAPEPVDDWQSYLNAL